MGWTRILAGILFFVLLHNPGQAFSQTPSNPYSLTLTWDPSPSPEVVGYHLYYGAASGDYTNNIVMGDVMTITITGLSGGITYFFAITAVGADGQESDYSNEVSYMVPLTNITPVIALTAPSGGAEYTAPASISLAAGVTSNGYAIGKVQFFEGTNLLGETASEPYSLIWSNVNSGSYSLTARAVYDAASTIDSSPVSINVTDLSTLQIQVMLDGEVVLTVTGPVGHTFDIEATQDFSDWSVIGTETLNASSSLDFTDFNAADFSQRFYRARKIP